MTTSWNAKTYSQFLEERTRPAKDLLSAIPDNAHPNLVYDLGCGPGNSTILLKNRWPNAKVVGIDSSSDMLKQARTDYPALEFIEHDIEQFNSSSKIDCIFANASLQWCDHHEKLIPRLTQFLNKKGVLAIQLPNNFHAHTHQSVIHLLQQNSGWIQLTKKLRYGVLHEHFYRLKNYYDILNQAELTHLQLWKTKYYIEMNNHSDIFNWMKGTGLRPVLSELNDNDKKLFEEQYIKIIATKYPAQKNGKILLPFTRIFMIGVLEG